MSARDETHAAYSLFQQPWWLDAVAPGAWDEVTVSKNGRVVARLPFVRARRYGFTLLIQPLLTQTLGPWVEPGTGGGPAVLGREMKLLGELIEQLPPADRFSQSFAPELTNMLPFHWQGYEADLRYTYRLTDLADEERMWHDLDKSVRKHIRRARQQVEVRDDLGTDVFLDVYAKTFARQGLGLPFPRSLFERVQAASAARGAGKMLFAEDAAGRVHAVDFVVFDAQVAYSLVGGGDPELRRSGAGHLLSWELVRHVAGKTAVFDFEGSMIQGVEQAFRDFGARQTPYLVVTRSLRRHRAARSLMALAKLLAGR